MTLPSSNNRLIKCLFLGSLISIITSCSSNTGNEQVAETTVDSFNSVREDETPAVSSRMRDSLRDAENFERLIGYWFMPHAATVNIHFYRDGRFVFNDFNSTINKAETLTGKFTLQGKTITLLYDDRPKQKFQFAKGDQGDENYYIKSQNYYFVGPGAPPSQTNPVPDTLNKRPPTDTASRPQHLG